MPTGIFKLENIGNKFELQTKILVGIDVLNDFFCIFTQKLSLHKISCKLF